MGAEDTITAHVDDAMRRDPVPSGLWKQGGWGPESIIEGAGSENIPCMAHSVKMGEEFRSGGIKQATWDATLGYLQRQPLYGRETCPGNRYHSWIDGPNEHWRLEADAHREILIADLGRRRSRAIMTLAALCAQPPANTSAPKKVVGTPHDLPWNEWALAPDERPGYASAYCGLSRAYVSPEINDSRRTNGRFNPPVMLEANVAGQMLAVALGKIKPHECDADMGAWLPALATVHGRRALFGLTDPERSLLLQVVEAPETLRPGDYETLAGWLDWNGTTNLIAVTVEWIAFEDGERVFFAHDSINNGSTNMCMGVVVRPDGYRQWLANSQPLRQKEQGVHLECGFDEANRTLTSRITQGYKGDPSKQHEIYQVQLSGSKILSHGRLAPRRPQLLVGGDPTSPPPPDEDSPTIDLVDFFFPPEMAGKHLKRSDGPGYTAYWRDDQAQCGAHMKHRDGAPIDFFAWTGSRMLLVLTEHGPEGGGDWGNERNYKKHIPGNNVWWPRFIPAGESVEIRTTIHDTGYVIAEDCVEGGRLDLRTGATLVSGPYSAAELGVAKGDIPPDTECYVFEWIWNDGQVIETFTLARGIGKVRWRNNQGLGGHVHDLIRDGAPSEPNFPCLDLRDEARRIRALPPASEAPPSKKDKPSGCRSLFILLVTAAGILASALVWAALM